MIEAGQLVLLCQGRDAARRIVDVALCLKTFDPHLLQLAYRDHPTHRAPKWWDPAQSSALGADQRFVHWLVREAFLQPYPRALISGLWCDTDFGAQLYAARVPVAELFAEYTPLLPHRE